jgi:ankyrin repeat protein
LNGSEQVMSCVGSVYLPQTRIAAITMSNRHLFIALAAVMGMLSCRREEKPNVQKAPPPAAVPAAPAGITMEAFAKAALDGDLATVKQALAQPDAANYADPDGRTALMLAAFNGHTGVVALLLDSGAKIDTRDQIQRTALMYACSGANDDTVALLVKRGAGVNLADNEQRWTPLMFAAAEGHIGVARILLDAGADPAAADIDGEDSIMFARSKNFTELADLIAKAKARVR